MWRNYFTVGVRALVKNRTYAFINIFGLAIGLAACLMLLLYVRYETTYDEWLPNAENTYQFQSHYRSKQTGEENHFQMTSYVAGQRLERDFPQVERASTRCRASRWSCAAASRCRPRTCCWSTTCSSTCCRFPLVHGDPRPRCRGPARSVLTQSEARRLFGREDVVGQTLTMVSRGISTDYQVTGIARDLPRNSHIRFTIVARIDIPRFFARDAAIHDRWGWQSGWYYFTLRPGSDPAAIQAAMPAWERRNIEDEVFGNQRTNQGDEQDWRVANIRDVHLGEAQEATMTPGNDRRTIVTFTIIAFLILGMACVNFTNLATARASQRAREVALRKVLGANRQQLITQFLAESVLIAAIAMLLALALVELLLPSLSGFLDATHGDALFRRWTACCCRSSLLTLLVGAAGGVYPAFYLSRFQPAQVLKANKSTAEAEGSGLLRNALVVAQFAVSIGLIICTAVVYAQNSYARNMDPGFRRDGLIQVENLGRRQLLERQRRDRRADAARARRDLGRPLRASASAPATAPIPACRCRARPSRSTSAPTASIPISSATMGIELVAGRLFDENRPADRIDLPFPPTAEAQRALVARGANIVINELAARRMGFRNPADAVGKTVQVALRRGRIWRGADAGSSAWSGIRGSARSASRSIRSCSPGEPNGTGVLLLRYDTADPRGAMQRVEQAWQRLAPDVPFDGVFSEDKVAELYEAEAARAKVFAGFAILAVIVACLGLFGLAAFTAERRTKEIGIRKVLGRAHPRHRPAARLAILQAGDHRQSDRLAGRLVGDARMAEHVRRAHRPRARRRS